MARASLKPHLNQIRSWVEDGRTDAWIAHSLGAEHDITVTARQIGDFRREQGLTTGNGQAEVDLRAADDEAIGAELDAEAEAARKAEEEAAAKAAEEAAAKEAERAARIAAGEDPDADEADDDPEEKPKRRRRSRRKKTSGTPFEATFDHGEEGYGLWLDPAVEDDAIYAEHWAGHRPVEVTIEEEQIVIRRAGTDAD